MKRRKNKKAVVLVLVIGLSLVAAIYAAAMLSVAYGRYKLMRDRIDFLKGQDIAYAGLNRAYYRLDNSPIPGNITEVLNVTDADGVFRPITIKYNTTPAPNVYDVLVNLTYEGEPVFIHALFDGSILTSYDISRTE